MTRLVLYNICYGIGTVRKRDLALHGARYVIGNQSNLQAVADYIAEFKADIVGLVEVDCGSLRARRVNQAEVIAEQLGHYTAYSCKYGKNSINQYLPILRKQSNAFLANDIIHGERFHYFDEGVKKLIIELEMEHYAIFLVHLSLQFKQRQLQLKRLYDLISETDKPVIVAGDMNTFAGDKELTLFKQAAGMRSANEEHLPSFPSWRPKMELDFILYQDGIEIENFEIPQTTLSDHLPLVCDFSLR
ncbi:MAG: endonuclease/exonuclease/phosphatase family protein [Gammaproteobacteria bacterium]|nr:endonuclease/exonuclease/phosphatase family protein [Gammaproteobacteria bacterium]MBT8150132.1 endonuclease/exonuclease/phosphatase family protein [Gammaproteobacteria bacterium]NND40079.1 endonuclease [Pseudomonadales bacterium]NNL11297.1 endonuclease [Pseudomonadales bacterium]NNM10941.1 endonuclease [Pseudomonadales bacterium]